MRMIRVLPGVDHDRWLICGALFTVLATLVISGADARKPQTLNDYLNQITADQVKMKVKEAQENQRLVLSVIIQLQKYMKQADPLFGQLFEDVLATGSFYEGLRAREPTEFDCAFLFKVFSDFSKFQVETRGTPPAFGLYRIRPGSEDIKKKYSRFFRGEYLDPSSFYQWFYGVVIKGFNAAKLSYVKVRENRPAVTLLINNKIDVDLMPAVKGRNWPDGAKFPKRPVKIVQKLESEMAKGNSMWLLGAKNYTGTPYSKQALLWRFAFSPIEKRWLKGEGCHKQVLRLLKTLKQDRKWDSLKSYYLKTLMMHAYEDPSLVWQLKNLGDRFMDMLGKLKAALSAGKLEYFWFTGSNMFDRLGKQVMTDYAKNIQKMIDAIHRDPANVKKYFASNK